MATKLKNSFSVLSLNVRSIQANIDEIRVLLQILSTNSIFFDALCFQETWLSHESNTSHLFLNGYNLITRGKSASRFGGLAIYLSNNYDYKIMENTHNDNVWEGLFIKVILYNQSLIIGNVYRPPDNSVHGLDTFLEQFARYLPSNEGNYIYVICGDYNIDLLKLNNSRLSRDFINLITAHGLIPKITYPTRITDHSATLIDNLLCSLSHDSSSGIFINKVSDHQACFVSIDIGHKKLSQSRYIKVTKRDPNLFNYVKQDLLAFDTTSMLTSDNPNDNYLILSNVIKQTIQRHTSVRIVKFNKHKHKGSPWITQGIVRSIKHRDKMYRKLKQLPSSSNQYNSMKTNVKTINNILRKAIRSAKKDYYARIFTESKDDIEKTWKNINKVLGRGLENESIPKELIVDGKKITNKLGIVNSLNSHFASVGNKLAASLPTQSNVSFRDYLTDPTTTHFNFSPVNEDTVIQIISKFEPKSTTTEDSISTKLLKFVKHQISRPIAYIINQSLSTGIFPDVLKIARVKSLFKKGDKSDPNNYRPISILPSISKIFEKAMLLQLHSYFHTNNLYFSSQYGFREKHSTELASLELLDKIYKDMDNGKTPFNIFIDLSKAFDSLNHDILLNKLKHYGVQQDALNLLGNYLLNRQQFTVIEDIRSNCVNLSTGVPQGSILGPFLFLVYINDLPKSSNKLSMINYADDTTLISNLESFDNNSLSTSINTELQNITSWLNANKLCLNTAKSRIMFFSPNRRLNLPTIFINGQELERVSKFNYLGIIINDKLSWTDHQNHISTKISKIIGVLTRLKHFLPQLILKTIYNSLIACHFHYGILAWGADSKILFKIQKKAVRIITNSKYNAHTDPLFIKLRILKIADIRSVQELKFYHKLSNGMLPAYFNSYINFNLSNHDYPTRNRNALSVPRFRHEFFRKNLRYTLVKTINESPNLIRDKIHTHSFIGFSIYVKNHYLSKYNPICDIPNCYICSR